MTRNGWIKLHRKLLKKAIWKKSPSSHKAVLITIMLLANHEQTQWVWKGKKYECLPGEFITSRSSLADESGETENVVRRALYKFTKIFHFCTTETDNNRTTGGTKITILNWKQYQIDDDCDEPGCSPGNGPGCNQDVTTNKNEKKNKRLLPLNFFDDEKTNEKCKGYYLEKGLLEKHYITIREDFEIYHRKKGTKYVDWYAAFQTWVRNEVKYHPERHKLQTPKSIYGMKTVSELMIEDEPA